MGGKLAHDPDTYPQARKVAEELLEGVTLWECVRRMNTSGVLSPGGKLVIWFFVSLVPQGLSVAKTLRSQLPAPQGTRQLSSSLLARRRRSCGGSCRRQCPMWQELRERHDGETSFSISS